MATSIYERASLNRNSIFHIILETGASLNEIVDNWIESYKNDKDAATIVLLQFLIDSCGCNGVINEARDDFTDTIRELTLNFNESSSEYPLIQSGRKWKLFKSNFSDFLSILIRGCQNRILYDSYFINKVIALLTVMSDSQVRAFRHTSTFATMKLITAFIEAFKSMERRKITSTKQLNIEQRKIPSRKAHHKLAVSEEIVEELDDNLSYLQEIIVYLFKSVFVLRFRDSFFEIRVLSIQELGMWLIKLPSMFLQDSHLKYIAWSLNDKVSEVRRTALVCVRNIFETDNLFSKIELFALKCRERIVSMTLDIDTQVAVEAVKVVSFMFDRFHNLFSSQHFEDIYQLVFSANAPVAQAAGCYLSKKLSELVSCRSIRPHNGSRITSNDIIIKELVSFFMQSHLHQHTAYLVDSLLESCSALKEWDCMTNLLLNEALTGEEALTLEEEKVLVDIMTCCIKQAVTGERPVTRQCEKKIKTVRDLRIMSSDKEKMTYHFSPILPQIMNKFLSNPEILSNLLRIPIYFDLNLFLVQSQAENVKSLLTVVQVIFDKYEDIEILQLCVELFDLLCDNEYSLAITSKIYFDTTVELIVNKFNSSINGWSSREANVCDEDIKFHLISSMKKISVLYHLMNLNKLDFCNVIFENIEPKSVEKLLDYPDEYMKYLLTSCYYSIMWDLNTFEEETLSSGSSRISLDELKKKTSSFIDLMEYLLRSANSTSYIEEAFKLYCDTLLIFGNKTHKFSKHYEGFISSSSSKVRDLLNKFCQNAVFTTTNFNSIEDVYKKRIYVSSYCKLFTYGVLPVYFITDLIVHYAATYSDFGDIFDVVIVGAKDLDNVDCARGIIKALIVMFDDDLKRQRSSKTISLSLKKVAKKFSSLLGGEKQNDFFLKVLHKEGMSYALKEIDDSRESSTSSHLPFFELLTEFSSKLNHKNKSYLLKFLNEIEISQTRKVQTEVWQYFKNYKKSLLV